MKILTAVLLVLSVMLVVIMSMPALARNVYQDTATPTTTATPAYVMENTVSVGEYGIATILAAQCLLIVVIAFAAALWGFLQTRKRG